jgi:hypothetical protein
MLVDRRKMPKWKRKRKEVLILRRILRKKGLKWVLLLLKPHI